MLKESLRDVEAVHPKFQRKRERGRDVDIFESEVNKRESLTRNTGGR
jgi:hypothetical protein